MAKKKEDGQPDPVVVTKREIEHIAGVKPDDGKTYLHTSIGFDRASPVKYEIYWLVPTTDEEAKARYDCNLGTLVESGVRQLTTRPDYKGVGFKDNGELKENGHELMQQHADNYKVGARVTGEGAKAKAKKLDGMVEKYGDGSQEELEAKLAKMKELEAQGLL